ncbi:MAG: RtcB family protein [Pirellulaceae bacterium]
MDQRIIPTGEATAILPVGDHHSPVKVFGTEKIRDTFDELCLQQAINSRCAPGVTDLVLNPDAHCGYGAPIGCVLASPTHIYPGPVGFDIKCSMSLLQTDLPEDAVIDEGVRRKLMHAICRRIPTGMGKGARDVPKGRRIDEKIGVAAMTEGASADVLAKLGIPVDWADRCEDAFHRGHDDSIDALKQRLYDLRQGKTFRRFRETVGQLGSLGGGNHFGECEVVDIVNDDSARETAEVFGLRNGCVAFLSHCGSRGIGHRLASGQFRALEEKFETWGISYPGHDKQLVYAPLGTPEADNYIDDMAMGANFATVNHLLINALVLEAFQEVIPGTTGSLVYFISHNIARQEIVDNRESWVHRKGATRAFPAGHHALRRTPFEHTGHPILLPGNPQAGSSVMVAAKGAKESLYSVNHGAGRMLGRRRAMKELDQRQVDESFVAADILTNCNRYPKDEAPAAYKDFDEVIKSVTQAGLATEVARLRARFVIKDAADADD